MCVYKFIYGKGDACKFMYSDIVLILTHTHTVYKYIHIYSNV